MLQGSGFDPLQLHKDTNEVKKLKHLLMAKLGRREQVGSEGRREPPGKRKGQLRLAQHQLGLELQMPSSDLQAVSSCMGSAAVLVASIQKMNLVMQLFHPA